MRYNGIEINILIKGKPITEYPHNGQVFVEGRANSDFEIEVRNTLNQRVEAVVSVDGLSVIDGKDAGPNSSGYLLEAHETMRIPGWKLNAEQVAAFQFAGKGQSYAAQATGSARNTGVIGLMAFAEKPRDQLHYIGALRSSGVMRGMTASPMWMSQNSAGDALGGAGVNMVYSASCGPISAVASASVASASVASASATAETTSIRSKGLVSEPVVQNLGTAFGQAQDFATQTVTFDRGDMLAMVVMYYDDARGLKACGIDLSRRASTRTTQNPVAFPGMTGCTPPPGWNGNR